MSRSSVRRKTTARASKSKPRDLTRDKVIDAGLALLDKSGADAITMRGLADAVGVTPMALYNHFSSKRDLLAAVVEHLVGAAQFDGHHASWRDQVHHCFEVLRGLCLRHPGLPKLLEIEGAAPACVFAPMEVTLRALQEAGLDDVDSVRTFFLLTTFTLGQAAYQTRDPIPGLEPSEQNRAERIAGRGYRATERLDLPSTWDFDASFAFGVSLILSGVEATASMRAVSKPSPGAACDSSWMREQVAMSSENEVRSMIENWARAVSSGNRMAIIANHSEDMRMFDFPDIVEGLKAYDETWDFFFANPRGPITFAPSKIEIAAGDDVAFASCLVHCDGTSAGSLDFRLTTGLRRIDGQWVIVHEHHSVPTIEERFIGKTS